MIMQKLGSFIEIRGIVFIAFDDEFFAAAESIAFVAEIRDYSADKKIRMAVCDMKNPGKHRGGGRFAVRSGNYD